MKILHIVRQFYPMIGGLENFVLSLAMEQVKSGNEVSVVTLNRNFIDGTKLPDSETYGQINIYRIPFFGSKRYPLAFSSMRYIKDQDIIHIHGVDFFFDYFAWTKFLHRKKIILHTHGGYFHTKKFFLIKKIFFQTATRISVKACNRIIAISDNDFKLFNKISNNIDLIENGVNIEKYQRPKKIDKGVLIYVGRIDVHKRIDRLIETVVKLNKTGLDATLKIIGPDWKGLQKGLLGRVPVDFKKKVVFLGPVDDETLQEEFSKAHLFVSASEYEGFGISAVEALASGTLTILNNIDSFNSFLKNNSFGSIVDFQNIEHTTSVIADFIRLPESDYDVLSKEARIFANRFSWSSRAQKIHEIYSMVIGVK